MEFIRQEIRNQEEQNVLFAVESGSRAWGIESENSDYDIRYIYFRSKEEYLKLFRSSSDTKQWFTSVDEMELDLVGWDIYKFLRLLSKSNPTCLEWIHSPIVYIDSPIIFELKKQAEDFSRYALFMHHCSMASQNYKKYIEDMGTSSAKKFLYVLRSQLSAIYILEFDEFPPLNFISLVEELSKGGLWDVKLISSSIDQLVEFKTTNKEDDAFNPSSELRYWIAETFDLLSEKENKMKSENTRSINKQELEKILLNIIGN